ncbi:helix-turn-helix domain-containing protein [Haloarchaeobius sp. DFWS5]|uniref:helix-turn-helix domain-containing protein n=1 Tax=Haloarchaeobius sp. DFWS5 TaxID=3446114 RepID=UPI003EB7A5E5
MLIAEFVVDHPILRVPLQRVPDIEVIWEETYGGSDGPVQMLVWITSDDFAAVKAALADDPSVHETTVLTVVDRRRLYLVTLTDLGRDTSLMPHFMAGGGVVQGAIGTDEGWRIRVRFPSREAFERVYNFCLESDIPFTFDRIYEATEFGAGDGPKLTPAQRELLVAAVESGYLSIPRESTLAELGDRLGISENAASERFRRAVKTLIEDSVGTDS